MLEVITKITGPLSKVDPRKILRTVEAKRLKLAGMLVAGEVRKNTPVGVSGGTRGSITDSGPRSIGNTMENKVFTPQAHGVVLERGRNAPGPMPPIGPIELWVRRKGARLGIPQANPRSMAFLIARKIARVGFKKKKGYRMFENAAKKMEPLVKKILGKNATIEIASKLDHD